MFKVQQVVSYMRDDVVADIQEQLGSGAEGAAGQRQAGEGNGSV